MDSSLAHLPPSKQADLARLVQLIRESVSDLEMIILYGSYARGDWKAESDLKPGRRSGHASDYDILVITGSPQAAEFAELRSGLGDKARALGLSAHPRFIAYDIVSFNSRLEEGRFFYTDIKTEGRVLYDSGREKLAEAKVLAPAERLRIVKDYYERGLELASGFFASAEHNYKEGRPKIAAFELHQAAEAAYKTILLVHTGYSPDEHWLDKLSDLAAEAARDPSLLDILPKTTHEQKRLFMLLDHAYIGARYHASYRIEPAELDYLSAAVRKLLERTQALCEVVVQKLEIAGKCRGYNSGDA